MAIANWAQVAPTNGAGSQTVNVGADPNTGRDQRQTSMTASADGVSPVVVPITQEGNPEFVTFDNKYVGKESENVTLSGITNSKILGFRIDNDDIGIQLPETYLAAGIQVSLVEDTPIPGDPGATAQFNFSITIAVPENTTIEERMALITAIAAGGQEATATLTQAAGDPFLEVDPDSVFLTAVGQPDVSVAISSNTNWEIE